MRKRELLILFVSIVLLLGGVACWLLLPQATNRINRSGFDAIREGMSEAEVEAILGGPAGDYRTGDGEPKGWYTSTDQFAWNEVVRMAVWMGDAGTMDVGFDVEGRVLVANFTPMRLVAPPLRERLRRWLGLTGDESGVE